MHPYFDLIPKYFPQLSRTQLEKFALLWDFYHEKNAKINVISRKDIDELYLKHVLHSLSIARFFKFKPGVRVLDAGTGGGFPGIPLSIYFEDTFFTLVDSTGKKIKVVNEAIGMLKLTNAEAQQARIESVKKRFDVVVCRAVTKLQTFVPWVLKKIERGNASGFQNGIIYLKGGDLTGELRTQPWPYIVYDIPAIFTEPYFETKKIVHLSKP